MNKLLALLLLVITTNAFAALPPCTVNGLIAWDNGLRYVCNTATTPAVWVPATTGWKTINKNTDFSITSESREILYVCSGVANVTLPSVATLTNGFNFAIKNVTATTLTITADGIETIDGSNTYSINSQYDTVELISNGTSWFLASHSSPNYWTRDVANQEIYPSNIGDQVGIGTTNPTSKLNILDVLGADTGNEAVVTIDYTTIKSISGNDTGLLIKQVDTLSPGTSLLIDGQVSTVSKFSVSNLGQVRSASLLSLGSTQPLLITGISGTTTNQSSIQAPPATAIFTGSTGVQSALGILPTYNQTSGAGAIDLLINRTETAVGTGAQRFIDAQISGVSKFSVDNKGTIENEGGIIHKTTVVNAATYDVLATDYYLAVTYTSTGAVTNLRLMSVLCDNATDDGRVFVVKDSGFNASVNSITVTTEGAETIDGSSDLVINNNRASVNLICRNLNWEIY